MQVRLAFLIVLVAICVGCKGDPKQPTSDGAAAASTADAAPYEWSGLEDGAVPTGHYGSTLSLIPGPRTAVIYGGRGFRFATATIVVDDDPAARAIGLQLARWLGIGASRVAAIPAGAPGPAHPIVLRLDTPVKSAGSRRDPSIEPPQDTREEAYTLEVSDEHAIVRAEHPAGLFYGAQSLAQIGGTRPIVMGGGSVPTPRPHYGSVFTNLRVVDAPEYRFRAMHLDVARHFFDKGMVERYLDILAYYKFNVFHWHLTDDQGFRFPVRSHPELAQVGSHRIEDEADYAGSYSEEDIREVIAFAKERYITVIPEIEMPGHARAILASHPELSCTGKKQPVPSTWGVFDDVLCAGNEGTFKLLGDILKDATDLFPSRLVHLGGDEVPKTRWNACPKCRARMASERLDAEHLQGAFMLRAGTMLSALGRRALAWDETLDGGLPKDGIVVAWQNGKRGAAAAIAGHDVVMAPSDTVYFNFWPTRAHTERPLPGHPGFLPWTTVFAFQPRAPELDSVQSARILGGEGALWTEYVKTPEEVEELLFPRIAALSEALWNPKQELFADRFRVGRTALDESGIRYLVEPPLGLRQRKVFLEKASLDLSAGPMELDGEIHFTLDGSEPNERSALFEGPIELRADTTVIARLYDGIGRRRSSELVRGTFERVKPHAPIQPSMAPAMLKAGVLYKYYEGEFRKIPDFAPLTPKKSGRLGSLSFDAAFRPQRFAVVYDAWFRAPADGIYRFVALADDGVMIDVDGVRVLADDGEHSAREADGEIALERGPHTIRISYFQGGGGKSLSLACEGPSLTLGPCEIVSP